MEVWKILFPSKWMNCRFHVNLPGCNHGCIVLLLVGSMSCQKSSISQHLHLLQQEHKTLLETKLIWSLQIELKFLFVVGLISHLNCQLRMVQALHPREWESCCPTKNEPFRSWDLMCVYIHICMYVYVMCVLLPPFLSISFKQGPRFGCWLVTSSSSKIICCLIISKSWCEACGLRSFGITKRSSSKRCSLKPEKDKDKPSEAWGQGHPHLTPGHPLGP